MNSNQHQPSHEFLSELDALCDEFEQLCQQNQPRSIRGFLNRVAESRRGQLLEALVELDVDHRRASGEHVSAERYVAEFPSFATNLRALSVFAKKEPTVTINRQSAMDDVAAVARPFPPGMDPTETHKAAGSSSQIGPYRLLRRIGEGGMGTVWLAEQQSPVRRRVAVKLIRYDRHHAKDAIARFEAERQALAMMDHPHIAKVLDAGTTQSGSPYFVMELVKGIPLTEFCDQHKCSIRKRLELFVNVCNAIQHAHQKGIIHRDLKPSNVLVMLHDGEAVPKVIDFGLAKALEPTTKLTDKTIFTEFGRVVGTPQYMSPEQAGTNVLDVDTRTDVYSLGVMLYELLTGSTPLDKETILKNQPVHWLELIRVKDPPTPSHRLGSSADAATAIGKTRQIAPARLKQILRGELDWVVMKALEKDRRRRYETASSFAEDIQRYLNVEAVHARPPSTVYKVRKFATRNFAVVATATTILLLLIAGLTGTSIGIWRAVVERNVANDEREKAETAKRKSLEYFATARDAVSGWLVQPTDDLKGYPLFQEFRRRTLVAAAADYEKLAKPPGNDAELATWIGIERGRVLHRLAEIHAELGEVDKADATLRTAAEIFSNLISVNPTNSDVTLELARTHVRTASLQHELRHYPIAQNLLTAAEQSLQVLVVNQPDNIQYREAMAACLLHRGRLLFDMGMHAESAVDFKSAAQEFEKCLSADPDSAHCREGVLSAHRGLGMALLQQGRFVEARRSCEIAVASADGLLSRHPDYPSLVKLSAETRIFVAEALRKSGNLAEEEEVVREILNRYESLPTEVTEILTYKESLASARYDLGQLLWLRGDMAEARELLKQSLAAVDELTNEAPLVARFREMRGALLDTLSSISLDLNLPEEAGILAQEASGEFESLRVNFPDVTALRQRLALSQSSLSLAFHRLGDADAAVQTFDYAIRLLKPLAASADASRQLRNDLAVVYYRFALATGDFAKPSRTKEKLSLAAEQWNLASREPALPEHLHNYADFLVTCVDPDFHDGDKAVSLVLRAIESASNRADYVSTLGAAQYRQGQQSEENFARARDALLRAIKLRGQGNSQDYFFLSMTRSKLGEIEQAKKDYDSGVAWMVERRPGNSKLQNLRREVEELLRIEH